MRVLFPRQAAQQQSRLCGAERERPQLPERPGVGGEVDLPFQADPAGDTA